MPVTHEAMMARLPEERRDRIKARATELHPSLTVHVGEWLKTEIVEPAGVSVIRSASLIDLCPLPCSD